jgi:hypothetical protein
MRLNDHESDKGGLALQGGHRDAQGVAVTDRPKRGPKGPRLRDDSVWTTEVAIRRQLAIGRGTFANLVNERAITVRRFPGSMPAYLRADVEKLVRDCVVPRIENTQQQAG